MVSGPSASHSAALHEIAAALQAEALRVSQRWDLMDRENVYHYTSVDAARNILMNLSLWSSDVLSMNDGSEFRYAISIVHEALMQRWDRLPIQVPEWFCPKKLLRIGSRWNIFAACFCSEPDLLGQWREYACGSKGVAIGFQVGPLHDFGNTAVGSTSVGFGMVPIQYNDAELRRATEQVCDFALDLIDSTTLPYNEYEVFWSEVVLKFLGFALRFKNPRFSDEREWRALTLDRGDYPTYCRGCGTRERKYVHIEFRPEMVSELVTGPLADPGLGATLRGFLDDHGLRDVGIRPSEIPLRA
jgi:hypothetical protein